MFTYLPVSSIKYTDVHYKKKKKKNKDQLVF